MLNAPNSHCSAETLLSPSGDFVTLLNNSFPPARTDISRVHVLFPVFHSIRQKIKAD